ncbi:MAG: DUF433 domain-containing protein [Chitinivibrionales bacterium]|nr:DUF433 domain-containing protein [Chitinivibrionales bacterium]MDD5673860.1 DUF433 domain-containing protein [Chitinivibrionales bacterium]
MDYTERISCNPDIMLGKPVIKGTRIPVEVLLRKLSESATFDELLMAYPHLKREDILAVLSYSADVIGKEEMIVS